MAIMRWVVLGGSILAACAGGAHEAKPRVGDDGEVPGAEEHDSDAGQEVILIDPSVEAPPLALGANEEDARAVLGKDERTRIDDTRLPPHSTVVRLDVQFPKTPAGATHLCSGTLIGEDAVLTAAHCVFSTKYGGRATWVKATPGAFVYKGTPQAVLGIGSSVMRKDGLFVAAAYADPSGYNFSLIPHDYAVVRLSKPLGIEAGYRELGVMSEPAGRTVEMLAYHGDLCDAVKRVCNSGFAQYRSTGTIRRVLGDNVAKHYVDSMAGASGAGMTGDGVNTDRVIAINAAEVTAAPAYNLAVLITPSIAAEIRGWLQAP